MIVKDLLTVLLKTVAWIVVGIKFVMLRVG